MGHIKWSNHIIGVSAVGRPTMRSRQQKTIIEDNKLLIGPTLTLTTHQKKQAFTTIRKCLLWDRTKHICALLEQLAYRVRDLPK
jgi:hypothetical protein